jgi:PAS domain S-box-containing protein
MFVIAILGVSVLLQLVAAALAIWLIRTTGKRLAWALIAAAILLMAVRQSATLYYALAGDPLPPPEPKAELVALAISVLMVVGVARMGAFFTGTQRLQDSLEASEAQAQTLYEYNHLMYFAVDTNGIVLDTNRRTVEELGYGREELIGKPVTDLFVEDDLPQAREKLASCLRKPHHPSFLELRKRTKDGSVMWVRETAFPLRTADGATVIHITCKNITKQTLAQEALKRREASLARAQHIAHVGSWEWDIKKNTLAWSDETYRIFGRKPGSGISVERFHKQVHPEDLDHVLAVHDAAFRNKTPYDLEYRIVRTTDGSIRHLHSAGRVEWDAQGHPARLYGSLHDNTERKLAEMAIRKSEARYRMLIETMNDGVAVFDAETRFTYVNGRFAEMMGHSTHKLLGLPAREFVDERNGNILEQQINKRRRGEKEAYELAWRRGDGTEIFTLISPQPIIDESGHFRGSFSVITDITERKQAEDATRQSEEQLRLITDALPVLIGYVDQEQRLRFVNRTNAEWLARPSENILGKTVRELLGDTLYERLKPYHDRAQAGEEVTVEDEFSYPDGKTRQIHMQFLPHFAPDGSVLGYVVLCEDFTERKAAETELFQAQKMQAVGQLTGGVAHDFNNLLTIVIGNLEILKQRIHGLRAGPSRSKPDLDTPIKEIVAAAKRGAALTQRLLAFSRKQPLQPKRVDLNRLIRRMSSLLHHTIGETVEMETVIHAGLWQAIADPVQVENAVLNLVLNARDAMPESGKITIETANVRISNHYAEVHEGIAPGQYVLLAVTDAGTGMSPEVVERAFEPFFTTKVEGGGSGLGLSTVYGFVKQSQGHVKIYSEEGRGTTVKIYLPRAKGGRPNKPQGRKRVPVPRGGGETILVVEDDTGVREVAVAMLEGLGYRVFEAENGPAALAALDREPQVDLMLTDVVMPGGLKADELMREAQTRHPGLKVLFMSGYAENAIIHNGVLDEGVRLLAKPFEEHDLDREIRSLLNGEEEGP